MRSLALSPETFRALAHDLTTSLLTTWKTTSATYVSPRYGGDQTERFFGSDIPFKVFNWTATMSQGIDTLRHADALRAWIHRSVHNGRAYWFCFSLR